MLLSEGFGWYTFQPPSSAVSTTLVGHYYSGVYMSDYGNTNVAIIEKTAGWVFDRDWFPLTKQGLAETDSTGQLDGPGIYDIGLEVPLPQIQGKSMIFYIGVAAGQEISDRGTLRKRLDGHIANGGAVEKWLRIHRPEQQILARTAKAETAGQALFWEKLRFRWFIEQYWQFPIQNGRCVPGHPMDERELQRHIDRWRSESYRRMETSNRH